MVTKVACTNPECPRFDIAETVASAMILGMNPKVCPQCGGHMKVVAQINTSSKGMRKHTTGNRIVIRGGAKMGSTRSKKKSTKRGAKKRIYKR